MLPHNRSAHRLHNRLPEDRFIGWIIAVWIFAVLLGIAFWAVVAWAIIVLVNKA